MSDASCDRLSAAEARIDAIGIVIGELVEMLERRASGAKLELAEALHVFEHGATLPHPEGRAELQRMRESFGPVWMDGSR